MKKVYINKILKSINERFDSQSQSNKSNLDPQHLNRLIDGKIVLTKDPFVVLKMGTT